MYEYWNTTDRAVTVDADGRQVDGGSYTILEETEEVRREVELGNLKKGVEYDPDSYDGPAKPGVPPGHVGHVPPKEQNHASGDTEDGSSRTEAGSGTLTSDKASAPQSTTKQKKGK